MHASWTDIGPADLDEGEVRLTKTPGGDRLVCLNSRGTLQVLDDRCPHEGYPLSQGSLRDGKLTCAWHNWKFDVCSGACTTGGDAVRHYPSRVNAGRLEVDLSIDLEAEGAKLQAGIAQGLFEDDAPRALRDALRLRQLHDGSMMAAWTTLAKDAARRAPFGFGHELACLADLLTWVDEGDLDEVEAFGLAATIVGERLAREPVRASVPAGSRPASLTVQDMLQAEDRDGAEAEVRRLMLKDGLPAATQAILPFVGLHILGYGHGAIYLHKAIDLSDKLPDAAQELMAAVVVNLSWATQETSLPPWAATRRALAELTVSEAPTGPLVDREAFESEVLKGEREAVQSTLRLLHQGVATRALLVAIAHAAARRLACFDPSWATRLDVDASVLDVSHTVTFAEACLQLAASAPPMEGARLAMLAAAFVGKLCAADGPTPPPSATQLELLPAFIARDPEAARAAARALGGPQRALAYRELRNFAAFEAFVRPIFTIHAVKGLQALARLEAEDIDADTAYLEAYVQLAARPWPERAPRRTAATARQFIADGRPPKGLY